MRLHEAEQFDAAHVDAYNSLSLHWDNSILDKDEARVRPQHVRLNKHYDAHFRAQGVDYKNPYYEYSGSSSRGLNNALAAQHAMKNGGEASYMAQMPSSMESLHKSLQTAIKKAPATPEHIVAFSGLGERRAKAVLNAKNERGTFVFPAYTSTAIRFAKATGFTKTTHEYAPNGMTGKTTQHVAVFHIPKNSRGVVYLGEASSHPHEQELLIHAGARAVYSHTTEHVAKSPDYDRSYVVQCHHFLYEQPEWADHPHDGHPFPKF